jgi:protein ImuA
MWSAEQILTNGSCGAVLLWQTNVRPDALRRLHLAAQSADTCIWLLRPISAQQDSSPSPLRLALRPAFAGVQVEIIKRRGPHSDESIYLPLNAMPSTRHPLEQSNALLDQRLPAATVAGNVAPVLV